MIKRNERYNKITVLIFSIIELLIWAIVLATKNSVVYYLGVVCCFLASLILLTKEKHACVQSCASLFTVLADLFLILLHAKHRTLAMCFFLCAQILYAVRIFFLAETKKQKNIQLLLRIVGSVVIVVCTFLVIKELTDALAIISVIYYVNLVISLILAFVYFKKQQFVRLMAIGFVLFSLCDITIGFDYLVGLLSLTDGNFIYEVVNFPISIDLVCYLPSQVLLVLSAIPNIKKVFSENKI